MSWDSPPKEKTYIEWHYLDIEGFVKNLWGVQWQGGAAMDYPAQNTYEKVEVEGTKEAIAGSINWADEDSDYTFEEGERVINAFRAGEYNERREEWPEGLPGLDLLLNWLCYEKHIPAGNYLILVWW